MLNIYPTSLSYEEEYCGEGITEEELNRIILWLKERIQKRKLKGCVKMKVEITDIFAFGKEEIMFEVLGDDVNFLIILEELLREHMVMIIEGVNYRAIKEKGTNIIIERKKSSTKLTFSIEEIEEMVIYYAQFMEWRCPDDEKEEK